MTTWDRSNDYRVRVIPLSPVSITAYAEIETHSLVQDS